jgi:hypothetical protein
MWMQTIIVGQLQNVCNFDTCVTIHFFALKKKNNNQNFLC